MFIGSVGTLWPGGMGGGGGSTVCLIGPGLGQNGSGRYGSTTIQYKHKYLRHCPTVQSEGFLQDWELNIIDKYIQ